MRACPERARSRPPMPDPLAADGPPEAAAGPPEAAAGPPQAAAGALAREAAEIVFDGATKRYEGASRPALDRLSLAVPAGDICVLVGPSGGGKTTALRMVNRLVDITEGDITIDGRSVRGFEPSEL